MDALWSAAARGGADIAIAGHDHHYERFEPITGWGDLPSPGPRGTVPLGLPSFVVGTGGRLPYPLRSQGRGSAMRITGTEGVLVLLLDEKSARYRFVKADGTIGDSGTISCR